MKCSVRAFKRDLLKLFDRSYIDLYQFGPKRLTVDILDNRILIVSSHARLPGGGGRGGAHRFVSWGAVVKVSSILNDYDPSAEVAAMVILAEDKLVFLPE